MTVKLIAKTQEGQFYIDKFGDLWEVVDVTVGDKEIGISPSFEIQSIKIPSYWMNKLFLKNWIWLDVDDPHFSWEIVK